jgi:hypothetical protein
MFAFSVTAARRAVHDTLVIGVKLHNHGWPERQDLSKMTGYQGATGGPWSTDASFTIQPSMYAGKRSDESVAGLHQAQEQFFTGTALLYFDPGCACSRLVLDLPCHAPVCVAQFVVLRAGVTVCGQQRPSVLRGGLWCGRMPGRVVLTVCLWGLFTAHDDLTWTPDIEANFHEKHDPALAFCKPRSGKRQPYSDLYMYFLMQTISRWPHVKAILPSGAELNKGPAHAETQCKKLVVSSYEAAFCPEHGISTMTLLDPKLYNDKAWVHAQVSPFHTILICSDQLSKER